MNFLVLVNNELQMRNGSAVTANFVKGGWKFFKTLSRGEVKDITEEFEKELLILFNDGCTHFLKPFTTRRNYAGTRNSDGSVKNPPYFNYDTNEILRVLNIKSEIYEIQAQLQEAYTSTDKKLNLRNFDTGETQDVTAKFLAEQEQFLISKIVAFSILVNHIERTRNTLMLANTYNMGIAFMVDNQRWMNLINVKMSSVDNPFIWLAPRLEYSKLVGMLTGKQREVNFNEPQIFSISERRGHTTYQAATPKDILSLLNINLTKKVDVSSVFVVQLMGVCFLNALGFRVETNLLPTTAVYYMSVDGEGNVLASSFNRDELSGNISERSILSGYLDNELQNLAGEFMPEFERMRLT
jgi:hypothetical protein